MPTSGSKTLKLHSLNEYPERLVRTAMGDEGENGMDDIQLSHVEIGLELCTALVSLLRGCRSDNNGDSSHKTWKTIRLLFCTGRVDVLITAIMALDNCECLEVGDFVADEPIDLMMEMGGMGDNTHEAIYFALAMGLPSTKTLKTLRLYGGISRQASVLLADGLGSCTSLESLELVDLIPVDEEASSEVTRGILTNTRIQHITMNCTFPTLLQAFILQALEERPTIILDLILRKGACPPIIMQSCASLLLANRVRKLILERVRVDREHQEGLNVPLLAHALESNTSLIELGIANNSIHDMELNYLIRALQQNTTLEQLDLSRNEISDAGKRAMAEVLPCLHLKRLLVQKNLVEGEEVKDSAAHELLGAMRRNFHLELLRVDSDFDGYEEMRLLGRLNRGGRRVLLDRNFPLSLWPRVLERSNRLNFEKNKEHAYDNLSGRAEIIYFLLHGVPNLVEHRHWT